MMNTYPYYDEEPQANPGHHKLIIGLLLGLCIGLAIGFTFSAISGSNTMESSGLDFAPRKWSAISSVITFVVVMMLAIFKARRHSITIAPQRMAILFITLGLLISGILAFVLYSYSTP